MHSSFRCWHGLDRYLVTIVAAVALVPLGSRAAEARRYAVQVLAPEHRRIVDPQTGAELLFATTSAEKDVNLYFHEYSWLADESVLLFTSSRTNGSLMGYLMSSGELIRFEGGFGNATAAARGNALYAMRGRSVFEITLDINTPRSKSFRSTVLAKERLICVLPDGSPSTALNPSCDGKYLALGVDSGKLERGPSISKINIKTGDITAICRLPRVPGYGGHVQWSRTNPNLLSFAGRGMASGDLAGPVPVGTKADDYVGRAQRLWVIDIRSGRPRNVYVADEGELVTHESWWTDDQLLFCGGKAPLAGPAVLSHVKALNTKTGQVCIVGAGAWLPGVSAAETAKLNWWHAAGSANGKWIAADNWHGDIMLFDARTTRPRLLTTGHRSYGRGEHPHVGWDRTGHKVVFTSSLLGDANVCIAKIPDGWCSEF